MDRLHGKGGGVKAGGDYPTFRCPDCGGEATLIDGDDGPEFVCWDCPIGFEVSDDHAGGCGHD